MPDVYSSLILPDVRQMVREEDRHGLTEFCRVLHPVVVANILEELDSRDVWVVLDHADLLLRVEIFEYIALSHQIEMVAQLDKRRLSELLEEMSPDDRVDLLSRMPHNRVEDLLPLIAQAERNDIRRLLSYDEDSAGSIMTTEYASLPANITVSDALQKLRQQAPDSETIYYIYILNSARRLEGLISLRELILARPDAVLSEIMERDVIRMGVDEDREDVAQELARYNFIAIPIVDDDDRLVGIVTHDDAIDVVQEEATEDAYRQGAVEPLRDDYEDTPLLTILWKRGIWLLVLSVVALMTAAVAGHYEQTTSEGGARAAEAPSGLTPALIFLFIPLVMASGGNAGAQSATLFIRMFALQPADAAVPGTGFQVDRQLILREFYIAAALGAVLALMDFLFVWLWFDKGVDRSLVVGLTVFLIVILGTTAGTMLPILFRRLGMDPAIMSNPLIAAIVDVLGIIIFYEVAMLLL
ncbi:MAG TPA: magnesium transporter [Planctomycetes bacterium]|nr:magnesium transporter [Fuerstiella sp.]HIK95240.1 magnesium transporter [Planctomycetota bacterium]